MERDKKWYEVDWILIGLGLSVGLMGVMVIAGAVPSVSARSSLWAKQTFWMVIGLFLAIGVTYINYRKILKLSPLLYVLTLILLLSVFAFPEIKGARSWIILPGDPFRIQPSEFAKLSLILVLARYLGRWQGKLDGFLPITGALILTSIPMVLVLAQPDMGTALVYMPICICMLFAAGLHPVYFIVMASPLLGLLGLADSAAMLCLWVVSVGVVLAWGVWSEVSYVILVMALAFNIACYTAIGTFGPKVWENAPSHAKARIISYLDEDFEPKKAGWNARQSKIALGSGGFWGHGWGEGTQSKLRYLPEVQHDFVFAVLGEQWGFFGCTLLLGLFTAIFTRSAYIASIAADTEGLLICVGVVAMYACHVIVNTGMVTGLLPITGLPLSFVSYGGSFMLANLIALGLVCSVSYRRSIRVE